MSYLDNEGSTKTEEYRKNDMRFYTTAAVSTLRHCIIHLYPVQMHHVNALQQYLTLFRSNNLSLCSLQKKLPILVILFLLK